MYANSRRIAALLVLLATLFALVVWFGTVGPAPALGSYPGNDAIGNDYDSYVGERVAVGGTVRTTDPVTIAVEHGSGERVRLTVTGLAIPVEKGEYLRVFGVARPDRTIRARNAFTVPRGGRWYAYVVSALAGCWVLSRIVRYWRIETDTWTLEPRESPRRWRELVGSERDRPAPEGDDA
jgi:hypothetical protein